MKFGTFVLALAMALTCGLLGIATGNEQGLQVQWEENFEAGNAGLPSGWTTFAGETMARTTDTARTGQYSFYLGPGKRR